jgi:hypothetical protein
VTGHALRAIAAATLLVLLSVAPAAAANETQCKADPPGGHDPKAEIKFTAILTNGGQRQSGKHFDYGAVHDLVIEVRWERVKMSVRQRLELYAPDGHLYQMFTTTLPALPDPVEIRVPVVGSWITSATLAGTWCARLFLDNELDPVAASDFELRRR